ncbi:MULTISPECIES: hypothetical protein [unclassified Duganella]|uniref:hypothetical protein n=1 Tax=unclassified Duganella TaxID=2636909 RepID=UPI000877E5CE|nr:MULTISPECIES: hypothetical protein [unclassified Duganella]OEZ60744.1 hypothetical protein DUGA6_29660 [Duganella sp. HH105]OFA04039.1 hypothetical protein DUGA2_23080 [Duganella sp. HH101]
MRHRENTLLSRAIQQAVIIDATMGAALAWAYLSTYNISNATILRVLSGAAQRRASDLQAGQQRATE